jgi:DNA-binding PadR family transcriptional regulator
MNNQPLPAGPFGPLEFGPAPFGPGPFGPAAFGRTRAGRQRRRRFRETMLTMSTDDGLGGGDQHGDDHEEGPRGAGRGRGPRGAGRGHGHGHGGRGGPGFDGFPGPFGRGPKAGRGDIRAGVLVLLAEQPRHGYEIIRELADRSGGVWRPSPGSIYPTLKQLAREGLVRADKGEGRRVFELTDAGRAYVDEHAEELAAPWEAVGSDVDDAYVQLRDLTQQVGAAVLQVGQAGTSEQVAAAAELLAETRRSLYRILAEDPETPRPTQPAS